MALPQSRVRGRTPIPLSSAAAGREDGAAAAVNGSCNAQV